MGTSIALLPAVLPSPSFKEGVNVPLKWFSQVTGHPNIWKLPKPCWPDKPGHNDQQIAC